MPETDIVLGDSDVEVRAADLAVFNSDGKSRLRVDRMLPSEFIHIEGDGDSYVRLGTGGLTVNTDIGTLNVSPTDVNLATGAERTSGVVADVVTAAERLQATKVEARRSVAVDGVFGGNPYSNEEPDPGRVEVLDGQENQTILLDGTRGVVETSGGDVAEYFPNGTDRTFDGGEVVGLGGGEVVGLGGGEVVGLGGGEVVGLGDGSATDAVADRDEAFVVAERPMLLGNRPTATDSAADDADHVPVALLGQVPVQIAADVESGDRLVATADGRAVPAGEGDDGAPTVGRAIESAAAGGEVTALVGCSRAAPDERDDRIEALEADNEALQAETESLRAETESLRAETESLRAENETLRAENEALRDRLAAVEERLAAVEEGLAATEGAAGATPADD